MNKSWKLLLLLSTIGVLFYYYHNILGFRFANSESRNTKPFVEESLVQEPVTTQETGHINHNSEQFHAQSPHRLEEIVFVQENFEHLEQTDAKLIRYVRARFVTPPPPLGSPYNLKSPNYEKSTLGKWIRNFYKDKRNGVFLEAGANSGEVSHTIALEIELGWSGVLVECNPRITPELRNAGRKAYLATVCLSTNGYPQVVNMSVPDSWTQSARLGPAWDLKTFGINSTWSTLHGIETVPLYSILAGIGIMEIDYFSFDIEGAEFAVLKSFPFHLIKIKVLIMEVYFYKQEERKELKAFLEKNGLVFIKFLQMDEIYVHNSCLGDGVTVEELAKM